MRRRYVLKNKKRFYSIVLAAVIMITTFVFTTSVYGFKQDAYKKIIVNKGDTLWEIASIHNKRGDIRKYIYNVKKINSLSDSCLYEGDELLIPQ